jgi:tetratricopeptide (TPR) repeat protein
MNEWLKQLQEGNSEALQKQLEQAQETMESMLNAQTPEERQKLASQLRKQLQDLKKFSSEKASSPELANALNQALKSLEALASQKSGEGQEGSEKDEMSEEATEALRESLKLSKAELQQLARSAKDMKKLDEALKTLQQAEKLNQKGQLDGEQCEGCKSLAEYAERYKKMMAGMGTDGEAQRNEPGAIQDEDDSDPEGYKDEKSKTQIQAGKVLLSIKTKEAATEKDFDPEELKKYESTVGQIKSGVQAAIENEQIPPGYVEGIKSYFDNLESPAVAQPAMP